MAWVKLDDGMPHHPKVMAAGATAFALDVAGICYSNRHNLDGFISESALPAVLPSLTSPAKWVGRLVEAGRWVTVDGGWVIHDIEDYQPTAEQQREISRKRAEAGKLGGSRHRKQDDSNAEATTKQVASAPLKPVPSRPNSLPNGRRHPQRPPSGAKAPELAIHSVFEDAFGLPSDTEVGVRRKVARSLMAAGATDDDVERRVAAWAKLFPPLRGRDAATLTVTALDKHWGPLGLVEVDAPSEPEVCAHPKGRRVELDGAGYCGMCGVEL